MLITFTSKYNADIVMFDDVASILLKAMGRSDRPPGILRGEDIKEGLDRLTKYLESVEESSAEEIIEPEVKEDSELDEDDAEEKKQSRVSLRLRALPLLEMLETAYREEADVIWR